jgi:hypothetical protein
MRNIKAMTALFIEHPVGMKNQCDQVVSAPGVADSSL